MSRRTFSTTVTFPDEPDWKPLEAVVRLARDSADLWLFEHEPSFFRSFPPEAWPVPGHATEE